MELSAHSDILIHWTGSDIDGLDISDSERNDLYFDRLKSILRFGLWMRKPKDRGKIEVNGIEVNKPDIARTCFTELKLSSSEDHAKLYGRLGIGVKRYFLFDRLGAPINYCQFNTNSLFFPPFSDAITRDASGEELLSFFKHMCSGRPLKYDLYNESEWRIVFSENIRTKLMDNGRVDRANLFVNPATSDKTDIKDYYSQLPPDRRPEYLIPLDPWVAIIIYPNLKTKTRSVECPTIRGMLKDVAMRPTVTGCPERGCYPMELDLAACKHF